MKHRDDDGSATARLAAKRLAQIAPGDSPEAILDALEPCMGVAAGLLMVVKPGLTLSVTHHALRIPMRLFEGWVHTQPRYLEQSLSRATSFSPGDFWRDSDGLPEELRSGMEVLHILDQFGLGEGAGLKLLCECIPGGGEEHVVMALLTHRGDRFPRQTSDICRALTIPLQEAVFRLRLPFTASRSIHAQVMEEDAVGLVCLGADGAIIELNQRAYELAAKYREVLQIGPDRLLMHDFVEQAQRKTLGGRTWQLQHPSLASIMQVRMHLMPKERFTLSRDLPIIKMMEFEMPSFEASANTGVPAVLQCLTQRQQEISLLLLRSGLSNKQIAAELGISEGTVRKHVENIHDKLKVHSLGELMALVHRGEC
jgi:DNA-binding NarL/FixJ family response regulator